MNRDPGARAWPGQPQGTSPHAEFWSATGSLPGRPRPLCGLGKPPPAQRREPVLVIDCAEEPPQPDSVQEHPRRRISLIINIVWIVLAHIPGEVVVSRRNARTAPGKR